MDSILDDPRVTPNRTSDESYDVEPATDSSAWIVLREDDGAWSASEYGGSKRSLKGFASPESAVEAIPGF